MQTHYPQTLIGSNPPELKINHDNNIVFPEYLIVADRNHTHAHYHESVRYIQALNCMLNWSYTCLESSPTIQGLYFKKQRQGHQAGTAALASLQHTDGTSTKGYR